MLYITFSKNMNLFVCTVISKMKLISWNVNGLRAVMKKGALITLLKDESPDIICLQETKCAATDIHVRDWKVLDEIGFHEDGRFFSSGTRKGYSGTAVLIKRGIPVPIRRGDLEVMPEEGRTVVLEFPSCYVVNMYVPNSKPDLSRLRERVEKWEPSVIELLCKLNKPVVVCGDFNVAPEEIDVKNYKTNRGKHGFTDAERLAFHKLLQDSKMVDTYRYAHPSVEKYTWFSPFAQSRARNVGWRIDFILASKRIMRNVKEAAILGDVQGSDHVPTMVEYNSL